MMGEQRNRGCPGRKTVGERNTLHETAASRIRPQSLHVRCCVTAAAGGAAVAVHERCVTSAEGLLLPTGVVEGWRCVVARHACAFISHTKCRPSHTTCSLLAIGTSHRRCSADLGLLLTGLHMGYTTPCAFALMAYGTARTVLHLASQT